MKNIFYIVLIVFATLQPASGRNLLANLKGNLAVSQGKASYALDILVPPGVAGVTPQLSFEYAQDGANGPLGTGWHIGGISHIARCGSTLAQDGINKGIRFNYEDHYCIDGQRLIAIQGAEGKDGTVYKTEIDDYSKIISFGTSGQGPERFVMYTKSGDIYEYGTTSDSKVKLSNGTVYTWKISKISDRLDNDNTIRFSYNKEHHIYSISYARNQNKIKFIYHDNRKDTISGYTAGEVYKHTQRLEKVSISAYNKHIRDYRLNYHIQSGSPDPLKLKNIQECDGECLQPIVFDWGVTKDSTTVSDYDTIFGKKDILAADFNNDGITDLYIPDSFGEYDGIRYGTADGNFESTIHNTYLDISRRILFTDLNADGIVDIYETRKKTHRVYFGKGNGTFQTAVSLPSDVWGEATENIRFGDFNGDGKRDILFKTIERQGGYGNYVRSWLLLSYDGRRFISKKITLGSTPKQLGFYGNSNSFDDFETADFNADGLTDIYYAKNIWLNQGSNHFVKSQTLNAKNSIWDTNIQDVQIADFNHDGYPDIYETRYKDQDIVWISQGNGRFIKIDPYIDCGNHKGDLVFADFNGDGYIDIYNQKRKKRYLNTGKWYDTYSEKFAEDYGFQPDLDKNYLIFGDFNGDSAIDIGDTKYKKILFGAVNRAYITKITDSFGNQSDITYKPLSDTSVYVRRNGARYPQIDLGSSDYVVAQITTSHNNQTVGNLTYRYIGLRYNLKGRGSLGFSTIYTTDLIQNSITETYYKQTYPFTGMPASEKVTYNGTNTSTTLYKYQATGNRVKEVFLTQETTIDNLRNIIDKKSYRYDKYGNTTYLQESSTNTLTTDKIVKTTQSTYDNDTDRWILGRLTESTVTHEGGDVDTSIERRSEYTYTDDGLLESETAYGEDRYLKKHYTYDRYGNKTAETISGSDIKTRTTRYRYDSNYHFLTKIEKPLRGYSETYTYNKTYGKPVTVIQNGDKNLKTSYTYDTLGRVLSKKTNGSAATLYKYDWSTDTPNSTYKITITVQGSAPVITYYDSFDRKVRVEKQGFDGKKIYEDTYYNAKGEVYKATPPYFADETPSWVTYEYDRFGRMVRTTEPAPDSDTKTTTLSYDGLTTVTTNEKGQTKTVTKNLFGKTAHVEDAQGNTISYTYDALGQLRETENSYDPPIVIAYDDFGNKKYLKDPDLGEWHYTYNVLGELTGQRDAKNQHTSLSYDLLGRLVKKVSGAETYTWSYNTKGFLTEERSNHGFVRKYSYDTFGRVTKESTTIDGKTYTKSYHYDNYGRVTETTQPGNFKLINDYNTYGYLTAIKTPKGNAEEISEERMKELMDKALSSINDYRQKASEYSKEAQKYESQVDYYKKLAKSNTSISQRLMIYAKKLQKYAAYYKRRAAYFNGKAAYYQKRSDYFFNKAKHAYWFRGFYRWYANRYLQYTRRYLEISKRYADYAKRIYRYEGYVKNAAKRYQGYSDYYLKAAKEAAQKAKESALKAKQYNQQAESMQGAVSVFQDMISDEKYTYFYYVLGKDAFGRTTSYLDGNGLINQTSYDVSGVMNYVTTGFGGDSYIRNISYTYDALGNLQERIDDVLGVNQQFEYDELNRVISAQTGGNRLYLKPMEYRYDANGNMTYKSDIGTYSYDDPDHVHAVTRAGNRTFRYDANGNMISNNGKKIRYNRFNKPIYIQTKSGYVKFAYDPSGNRYKKETQSALTHYLGKTYEKIMANDGTVYDKYYIYADGKVQAVHTNSSDGGFETRYLHYDALGSVDTVTDMNGLPVERAIYQPFGKKILLNEKGEKITASSVTNRGYTGHEHIEESESLIHMNGRVYDSSIGRFISADPHIQAPEDTQSYNRYSYVKNNPLKYTDPSGYFFSGLKKWVSKHWKAIVTTAVTVAVGVMTGGTSIILQGAAIGFSAGAVGTLVNGGTLGSALRNGIIGGLFGAVSAGLTYGVAEVFGHGSGMLGAKAFAHGAVSSFMTRARGGKWNAGFWSGFAGTLLSPVTNMARGYYAKVAASAMVAGTVSAISGGKFANGAFSGAFRFMFNDNAHSTDGNNFWRGIKKGFSDFFEGVVSLPKAAYAYGDYLARLSGFRDWQHNNILPWNRWEAEIEFKVVEYGLTYHKEDIASALWQDIQARPNYYIGGMVVGAAGGQIDVYIGRAIGISNILKVPGSVADTVHTKINPFH